MKTWIVMIAGLGLLWASQHGSACVDPVLKTNTDVGVRQERYHKIKWAGRKTQVDEGRGAEALRVPKEACFLYPNLDSQYEIPCLAPLIRAYDALPKTQRRVTTVRDGKRLNVCVTMVGTGTHNKVLICLPGVMADSAEFRFLVGALANDYDFWLMDPPGCGGSDAPDPETLGPGGYGPGALAERILQAIAICLQERGRPVRAVMVGHSLGGMVALRAVADPGLRARYGQVVCRIEGLILLAPANVFMSQVDPELANLAELSGLRVKLGSCLGKVPEAVAQHLAASFYASHCLPREEVDHAVRVVTNPGTRNAFKAMLREAAPFDERTRQPKFPEMLLLETWYTNVNVPCEIIWGKCDQTLPVAMGYMLEHQLPDARLTVIPDCKHAPVLECPTECARLIRQADRRIAAKTVPSESSVSSTFADLPRGEAGDQR